MVMENDIKQLYSILTGGKEITGDGHIISGRQFSSITRERFITELKKKGVTWDGADTDFASLVSGAVASSAEDLEKQVATVRKPILLKNNNGLNIGVDIQDITEMPVCADYWEDAFYKSKFTSGEIGYCLTKEKPAESFAGIFACKEALVKCDARLLWEDIEIIYSEEGKPRFGAYNISISHSGNFAVAVAAMNELPATVADGQRMGSGKMEQQAKDIRNLRSLSILLFLLLLATIGYIIYKDFI